MATIAVQELGPYGADLEDLTFTALTEVDNDFANDGQTILIVKNGDSSAKDCTVTSVPDPYGRLGDLSLSTIAANGGLAMTGFLNTSLFGGTVNFTVSATTSVSVAAVRIRR